MKYSAEVLIVLLFLCTTALAATLPSDKKSNQAATSKQPSAADTQDQRTQQMAAPEINKERQAAEQQAKSSLNQEAISAITSTKQAIDAINANQTDQALAAIEQATGKINVLLARNPSTALIPVSAEVRIIDTAPADIGKIRDIAADASWAVEGKNFPAARVLLDQLMSEIRVRTYNLPLATYPTALQEAARLLDQKKTTEAANVLQTALSTLVAVDKVTPIPLVVAREAINEAQTEGKQDKDKGETLLQVAKTELQRARELGYAGKDQEYTALNNEISNLEKQLSSNGDTNSLYARLKERLSSFLHRQSQQQNGSSQPQRTAQAR